MSRKARWGTVAILVLLFVFVLLAITWGNHRPSDKALVQQFATNRLAFEAIRDFFQSNRGIFSLSDDGISDGNVFRPQNALPPFKISPKQRAQYLPLLQQTGAREVFRADEEIRFYIDGSGFVGKGWRLMICWTEKKPEPVVDDLSNFKKKKNGMEVAYRPLGDDWYILLVW